MKLTPQQLELRRERQALKKRSKELQLIATELVDKGYAQMARKLHPDVGGSMEVMFLLGQIRDYLQVRAGRIEIVKRCRLNPMPTGGFTKWEEWV